MVAKRRKTQFFRDPVHGFIEVRPHEEDIINSPVFQRLRRIRQLSFCHLVYHGAEHSRFGHSIGVMHLASRILNAAARNTAEYTTDTVEWNEPDETKLRLAALLHDVGHPPFSHGLEERTFPGHEKYSSALIEGHFAPFIEKAGLKPKEISELVQGVSDPKKPYLAKILSSQLDADRMDYLTRDSRYTGVMYGVFDLERLVMSIAVKDGKLVVLQKGLFAADQFVISRFYMYEQVYLHRVKRSFEGMASLFAKAAGPELVDYPAVTELTTEEGINKFLTRTDDWFLGLLEAERNKDSPRANLAKQLSDRTPYRKVIDSDDVRSLYVKREGRAMEDVGLSGIDFLHQSINENRSKLGINELEVLYDTYRNLPLHLRPYSIQEPTEDESVSPILVYDDEEDSLEPIENRSIAIRSLSERVPRVARIYSGRGIYDKVNAFVSSYKESLKSKV